MQRSNRDQILDAVAASIRAVGLRRTTMADVARRAGLSRSTLYTHFADVTQAAAALLTRELLALLPEENLAGVNARARVVATAVHVAQNVRDHPLIERILELDAELLVPYLVTKLGSSQRAMIDMITAAVADGQADGSIRTGDPAILAFTVFLSTQAFVVSSAIVEAEFGREAALRELAHVLDRSLAPVGQ